MTTYLLIGVIIGVGLTFGIFWCIDEFNEGDM